MNNSEIHLDFVVKNNNSLNKQEEIIHNKNSRKNKVKLTKSQYEETIIMWSLHNYKGKMRHDGIEFQYRPSKSKLNNGLSYEVLLPILNSKNIFKNYLPKENDFLSIRLEYKHPERHRKTRPYIIGIMSFIYNNEWRLNKGYEHAHNCYSNILEGEIIIK